MQEMLELYRDRLTDLTANNRSLKLMKLTNKNHFDIHSFETIQSGLSTKILEGICSLKEEIVLIPQNSTEEEIIMANRKLTQLKREVDLIEKETGNSPFFIGYGFLEGYLIPDFFIRCPILFYPARLVKKNVINKPCWVLEVGEEATPFVNPTFIMAIQKYIGGDISESVERELDTIPQKLSDMLVYIHELLIKHEIQATLESDQAIMSFRNLKKENIAEDKKELSLFPYSVMGKFQQSGSTLLNDYNQMLQVMPETGLLNELINGLEHDEREFDEISLEELNKVHPADNFFVLDTDASQEAVIIAARDKKGLIVHGPPGTGKSQVIVNLIVDRMSKGQKVLLVCQKPAALDVVYNRLGQINLQSHVALVHDYNKNKSDVYSKIASVIDRPLPAQSQDYNRISNEKHALAVKLNKIAGVLHQKRAFGKSLYDLYSAAKWDQNKIIDVEDLLHNLTYHDLESHRSKLKDIIELKKKYDHSNYAWSQRKSFVSFTVKQHMEIKTLLDAIIRQINEALKITKGTQLLYKPIDYVENLHILNDYKISVSEIKDRSLHKHINLFFSDIDREFENEDHLVKIRQTYSVLTKQLDVLKNRTMPVNNLTYEDAKKWSGKIKEFLEINQKLSRFVNAGWYSLKKELQQYCIESGISFDGHSVRLHLEQVESFIMYENLRAEAHNVHFFSDTSMENNTEQWASWLAYKEKAIQFLSTFVHIKIAFPQWLEYPDSTGKIAEFYNEATLAELQNLIRLAEVTQQLLNNTQRLRTYLVDEKMNKLTDQIQEGIYHTEEYDALLESLEFDSLCALDVMKAEMSEFEETLLNRCDEKVPLESTPDVSKNWLDLILNSFLHAWITEVESVDLEVKDVSTEMYQRNQKRFGELLKEKRKAVPALIDSLLFNISTEVTGNSRQKLKNESNKKRRQAPLRQIVGHFYDDLLKLVPCWLCTPEAVSAIFPLNQQMFDLVIFDEASQCTVENAIPSIYRAKQLIIAGDEKQLPPSSFFQISSDEEDDDNNSENSIYVDQTDKYAQSLLEWAKPKFPDQWLTWHYRSEYEELINFSNYAFYDQRIQIAPSSTKGSDNRPIQFLRVDGKWENRSNRVEADKIVDTVIDILLSKEANPTIGIITFNKQQADLINDIFETRMMTNPEYKLLLEEEKSRKNGEEDVGLFVKNIENVQGDERDIILFSVGYAKDMNGKMVSQFGPLSREGGENRLNVAISRAKRKVYIVCSFEPSEWTRVETYARGVRMFKRYLEYGKAISDGNDELSKSILNGLTDATNVQERSSHLVFDSGFEEEVCAALQAYGYDVETQVGASGYRIDLAILDPLHKEKYILGIECDGAAYHSSKVARERDLYRQRFLESKGWRIHRIWSRNWWLNKNKELEKIVTIIKDITKKQA